MEGLYLSQRPSWATQLHSDSISLPQVSLLWLLSLQAQKNLGVSMRIFLPHSSLFSPRVRIAAFQALLSFQSYRDPGAGLARRERQSIRFLSVLGTQRSRGSECPGAFL